MEEEMKKEKEKIHILINKNTYDKVDSPDAVLQSFFERQWDVYPFMSVDAIKQHMICITELIQELEIKLTMATKKTIKIIDNMVKTVEDRQVFINFIVNFILAREGLGLLPGFGCAITEKASKGNKRVKKQILMNPEKQPMNII